ncbi:hypothetical protein EV196_11025 [Mariniflexile fucanivorans]|uniref:Regulatory LuxR family protein n=1 Tax=Mariniflexile fucanivorans TaxID=264023 RepID=A0A4R1RBB2_9FLAO|nr:hypothetical protein [Mariniflexile fucanivorans]TCL63073.1 hypothetical protein EV196_11025 [Mariniflexile fucanivorans]
MFKSLNIHTNKIALFLCFFVFCVSSYCQNGKHDQYIRFVDSAKIYINEFSKKAEAFLDSIPEPIEDNIKGRLADYYSIKALLHGEYSEHAGIHQSYLQALKYADKENNYKLAGNACLELFSNLFYARKDSLANIYLDKAKTYFELDNNANGLLEVEQMHAYAYFSDRHFNSSNKLLLKNLNTYKKVEEDAYFYMFATYMLTSSYIELDSLPKAYKYLNEFERLEANPTIVSFNYESFSIGINLLFAEYYLKHESIDSVSHYLSQAVKQRNSMSNDMKRKYFTLKADTFKLLGDLNKTEIYLDSIILLENKVHNKNLEASIETNNVLLKTESDLEDESKKKFWNGVLAATLFFVLFFSSIFYFIYYRKNKYKLKDSLNKVKNLSYLKSNNEKLTGKVLGLEEYIVNLKKEVKNISTIHEVPVQREKIKDLYKNLHHNSSTLVDKSENHLELINILNVEFFNSIKSKYPQLNDSELIICYYLYMDFKNKEIAVFLNISVRALESKRYRISKKINLNTKETSLVDHLKDLFKDISLV